MCIVTHLLQKTVYNFWRIGWFQVPFIFDLIDKILVEEVLLSFKNQASRQISVVVHMQGGPL